MKMVILILAMMFSFAAHATVDVQGQVTIVVEDIQGEDEYFLRTVPAEYCVGIESLTLATAISQPVTIKANYGCGGGMDYESQINAATCADISAEETDNWKLVKVKMDLSGCGEKAQSKSFTAAVRQAVENTYKSNGYQMQWVK